MDVRHTENGTDTARISNTEAKIVAFMLLHSDCEGKARVDIRAVNQS